MPGMTRLKIGVLGCGAIAQVQHLPHLNELDDQFEIAALCDLSPKLLRLVGEEYRVAPERRFTDYGEMLRSDVEAVIVCPSADHAAPSIAAAEAGKHVFVEKPMCTTRAQAEAMVAAAEKAGVVMQVGYMKRHEPAYRYAKERVAEMSDVRFVQVNHLHCGNDRHLADFRFHRADDLPPRQPPTLQERRRRVAEAMGLADPDRLDETALSAFQTVLGSFIHDIGNLSGLFGPPTRVVSTELWNRGRGITTVLEYPDEKRAVCSWVSLPELWEFTETLEVYGSRERVLVSFPTGFSKGAPSTVTLLAAGADGHPYRKQLTWRDNPFKLEIQHFRECILTGTQPITPGRDAIADVALVADIVKAWVER
jgi:predicted dehydrogenase